MLSKYLSPVARIFQGGDVKQISQARSQNFLRGDVKQISQARYQDFSRGAINGLVVRGKNMDFYTVPNCCFK
jgi:hypothetical protein